MSSRNLSTKTIRISVQDTASQSEMVVIEILPRRYCTVRVNVSNDFCATKGTIYVNTWHSFPIP